MEIPEELVRDLVKYFLQIADEIRTVNLEKSSAGKFVETIVQVLQSLDQQRTQYDQSVQNVDNELNNTYSSRSVRNLPDESRIAITRIARAIYSIRSKRSMIHKNKIDPNIYDLELIYYGAQWIMTELVRITTNSPIEAAKTIIEEIQRPVYPITENIMGRLLVLDSSLTLEEEILVVLYNEYSKESPTTRKFIGQALDRKSSSAIRKALPRLWKKKLIEGSTKLGYTLTRLGVQEAQNVLRRIEQARQKG